MEMGFSVSMDYNETMSVTITTVATQLPKYSRTTEEIIPFLDTWLYEQDERFVRKVKKIFENAAVDKRYSIMDPIEVFTAAGLGNSAICSLLSNIVFCTIGDSVELWW